MVKKEEQWQKTAREYLDQLDSNDRDDDEQMGNRAGWELPDELATTENHIAAIKKAKADLEAEAIDKAKRKQEQNRAKAAKDGKEYNPRKDPEQAKPDDKDQYNFTDPESRIMGNSDKASVQAYNAQATVDVESYIILAADVSSAAADCNQLIIQMEQVKQNTGRKPVRCCVDAGCFSEYNLEYLESVQVEPLIPPDQIKHNTWRNPKRYWGRIPKNASRAYKMRRRLSTKAGRVLYKLRMASFEPVYGFIKQQLNLRQFLQRGIDKPRSIW